MKFWKEHFLFLELLLCAVIFAGLIVWAQYYDGLEEINKLLSQNRSALYSALASIFGSLLGFTITAVSIILAFANSPRLKIVRGSKHYMTLWSVFISAIRTTGLATLAALIALLFDRDTNTSLRVMYACLFFSMLAGFRVARCIWVLEKIIFIVTKPTAETTGTKQTDS